MSVKCSTALAEFWQGHYLTTARAEADEPYLSTCFGHTLVARVFNRLVGEDRLMHTVYAANWLPDKCPGMLEGMLRFDDVIRAGGHYGARVEVPTTPAYRRV